MAYDPLWKYCTAEHARAFLLSLRLLGDTHWPAEKQLGCLYAVARRPERHYRSVAIQKCDGTPRRLRVPDPLLKRIQRNILHHVLDGLSVSPRATAYRPGASIAQGAAPHVGQKLVLTLDIEDFFGSITFPMVYRAAFPAALFPPHTRWLLTSLCCDRDRLPQGAPTSAAISNLVMRPFDAHMDAWCAARGIRYTRYCDDMAFSGDFDARAVTQKARAFLAAMGFALNEQKTRAIGRESRQTVTGVVVNEKPQVSRAYRRALRQEIHYCETYGVRSHLERLGDARYLPAEGENIPRYLRALLGRIGFVLMIRPDDAYFQGARAIVRQMLMSLESANGS